jgi:acetyl-CoA C-acetyltransferase
VSSSPCLVGWSQVSRFPGEPLEAWAEALRRTGVDPARIDTLDVVYCQSWPYDDPPGRLAAAVGASPRLARYSGIGGTTPQVLVNEAAERILRGEAEVCAVVGGEALDTLRRAKKAGERVAWSHRDPERKPFPFEAPFHPAEVAHELYQAYSTFALRDVARRARVGTPPMEHQRWLGELFAPMTKVAASNPHAWFPVERTAEELSTPTAGNRLVAYPYTKTLMSVMDVDLAGAVVLASAEAAASMGVAPERRVHLRGWSYATDAVYVAEHDDLSRSPAMSTAFAAALGAAGVGVDDVAHLDLYSCFPSSVAFSLDALNLRPDDDRAPFTVTGGLPYYGGAGSCYQLPAMAAMADVLVADPGAVGMTTGVGMHMTKHSAAVWSTAPGPGPVAPAAPDAGPALRRPIAERWSGPATVAAYTVHHGRDGGATDAVVVCDVDGAARCYGKALDASLLAALEAEEWVGRRVTLVADDGGVNLVVPTS